MAEPNVTEQGGTIRGVPVGILFDLLTKFTVQVAMIGMLVFGGYCIIKLPPVWIEKINDGVVILQKNWIESEKFRDELRAAREKENEAVRAAALDRFTESQKVMASTLKDFVETQRDLALSVREQTKHVMGRSYTTPAKKQPEAAKQP